jgi:hypothetical protein
MCYDYVGKPVLIEIVEPRTSRRPPLAPKREEIYSDFLDRVYSDARERGYNYQESLETVAEYDKLNARRFW